MPLPGASIFLMMTDSAWIRQFLRMTRNPVPLPPPPIAPIGIEIVPEAAADARRNARRNGIENASFIAGDVAEKLGEVLLSSKPDAIILDPPRKGVEASVIKACAQAGAKRIGYVSCSPSTLARDLKEFVSLGYTVDAVQPVDMFPQTTHVECVVLLTRTKP